jgi:hypothetical protein
VLEIKPDFWLPPSLPFTSHVTAVFELPVTVAENCCVRKLGTFAVGGCTATWTADVVVTDDAVLPPPQPPRRKTREEKNTTMAIAARVMNVPWKGNLLN